MNTLRQFALFMLIPAVVGVVISLLIGWEPWHAAAFTVALATLPYSVSVWMGAEPPIRLEAPLVGVPIVVILGLMLWWGHFGAPFAAPRPVTLCIQGLTCAPFVALTVLALFRLD